MGLPWILAAPAVRAAAFTVSTTDDAHDADPGDGACADALGRCTLRAAVEEANAAGGAHEITLGAGDFLLGPAITAPAPASLVVTSDVTITGLGRAETRLVHQLDNSNSSIFELGAGASLDILRLSLVDDGVCCASGVELTGDGSSLHTSDVLFDGLTDMAVYVGSVGGQAAPNDTSVRIEDSTIDGHGVSYSILAARGRGHLVELIGSTIVDTSYALLVDGDEQPGAGLLRVVDSTLTGDGSGELNGIEIYDGYDLELVDSRISGYSTAISQYDGRLDLSGAELVANTDYAIIASTSDGPAPIEVTIDRSTIRGNHSGIDADGALVLTNSTVTGNAIFGVGANYFDSIPAVVTNSTISGNGMFGIAVEAGSVLRNVTITENGTVLDDGPAVGGLFAEGVVTAHNTVIAGNVGDCHDHYLPLTVSGSNNADSDGSCGFTGPGHLSDVDPLLGPLADNGGPTPTHAPLTGSPLLDAGNDAECAPADQRSAVRPVDGDGDGVARCDLGAVEAGAEIITATQVTWTGSLARRGMLRPDDDVDIEVTSIPTGSATATVHVSTWYPGGDVTQPMAGGLLDAAIDVALVETSPGIYVGSLPLGGIDSVNAIDAEISVAGDVRTASADVGLPVQVAGALDVTTALDVAEWTLPDPRVHIASTTAGDGDSLAVPFDGTSRTRWLRPGDDYVATVVDGANRTVATPLDGVEVRGGLVTPVIADAAVRPYVPFSAVLRDSNDHPVEGVRVTVVDDASGDEVAKATTGSDGRVDAVARGDVVQVVVDPGDRPYSALNDEIQLTALGEDVVVPLGAGLPTARISGTVTHPLRPVVAGARVTFTTEIGGRFFTTSTRAGDDGRYSAEVLQGAVTVRVDEPRTGRTETTVELTADTVVDLLLDGPVLIDLDLKLLTRYAGESTPTPIQIDGTVGHHFHLTAGSDKHTVRPRAGTVEVPYYPGETIAFCAHGFEADLPAGCADAVIDIDGQTGTATVLLEQVGRIVGELTADPTHGGLENYEPVAEARLFRVEDDGGLTRIATSRPSITSGFERDEPVAAAFDVPVDEPGTYELRFELHDYVEVPCTGVPGMFCGRRWMGSRFAAIRTAVDDDAIVDAGTIALLPGGLRFSNSPSSHTTVSPSEVMPGETARVRVAAHNSGEQPVADARLEFDVPAGTTVVAGSVTLDGVPVAHTLTDGVLTVPVGTIAADRIAVLTAWLQVGSDIETDGLAVAGRVVHGVTTERLGTGATVVRRLTLNSVDLTSDRVVPLWGRSLPGSAVEVTVDGAAAATTTATAGGYWATTVTLPETMLPRRFTLEGRTTVAGGGELRTQPRVVEYDARHPTLQRAVFRQRGGRVVEIDPGKGLAAFPYVWVPREPIIVELDFDQPSRVRPPVVWVGSASATARYDGTTGRWVAELRPSAHQLGDVRVSWEPIPPAIDLAPVFAQPLLTTAEARAALPAELASFTSVELTDASPGAPTATATFPDLGSSDFEVTTVSTVYTPTDADVAQQATTGVPIWSPTIEQVDLADGTELTLTFVVPESALNLDDASPDAAQGFRGPVLAQAVGTVARSVTIAWRTTEAIDLTWKGTTAASDAVGTLNANEFQDKLSTTLDWVDGACSAFWSNRHRSTLDSLNEQYMGAVGISMALMVLGLAVGPETLGLGTLAVWGISEAINRAVSARLDSALADLRDDIRETCDPDRDDPSTPADDDEDGTDRTDCAPEGAIIPASLGGPVCFPIAEPTYIHDPSGYVYEVVEDQRLEGVTATLETATSPGGPWTIWDAEWYLQQNPLVTDSEGRYGWDVPAGWWRVRYELDGYESTYSEVLEVLPPHFDVNVEMRNLAAPQIASIDATAGSTTIDVHFDQWIDATTLTELLVGLADGPGTPTVLSVTPLDARSSASGAQVARSARIEVDRMLELGEGFVVTIDRAVRSASAIPFGDDVGLAGDVVAAPPQAQTIALDPIADRVYGSPPFGVPATASSGLPVSLSTSGPCGIQATLVVLTGIGECTVTASQAGDDQWAAAIDATASFTVAPAPLTVSGRDVASEVGDPMPTLRATAVGLVAGDTLTSLGGLSCTSDAPVRGGVLDTAGSYTIACAGLVAPHYAVTYVAGRHLITQRPGPDQPDQPDGHGAPGDVVALSPARLLDTRSPSSTVDGQSAGAGLRPSGSITEIQIAGRGGVPADAAAAVLNVAAVGPAGDGFLTMYPCGTVPNASNLNFRSGVDIANVVVTQLDDDGAVCIYTSAATHLLVDVNGHVPTTSAIGTLVPARLLDTRSVDATIDGRQSGGGRLATGTVTEVQVAGRGGVPDDAVAAVLNVTVVGPTGDGYATVYPCGGTVPYASNLNYRTGIDIANSAVVTPLDRDGTACVYTSAAAHLLADVNGYVGAQTTIDTLTPARLLDTRGPGSTIDGYHSGGGPRRAGSITEVQIGGRAGVPLGAVGAVLSVTAVGPSADGYLTVFACDQALPRASNVNYRAGVDIANAAITELAATGSVCIYTSAATHLLTDVSAAIGTT